MVEISHTEYIDESRFMMSFNVYLYNSSGMLTYGYDGEWFYIGKGSIDYNIEKVRNDSRITGISLSRRPQIESADFIFKNLQKSIFSNGITIEDKMKDLVSPMLNLFLRDHKINEILS